MTKPAKPKAVTQPAARGRPSTFRQETADLICERIVESDYGLEQICEDESLPSPSTIYRWLNDNEAFREQYARAKLAQGHVQADRATKEAILATDASLGRLKWDARRWAASKLAPKQYGDKLAHVGGDASDAPIQHQSAVTIYIPDNGRDAG